MAAWSSSEFVFAFWDRFISYCQLQCRCKCNFLFLKAYTGLKIPNSYFQMLAGMLQCMYGWFHKWFYLVKFSFHVFINNNNKNVTYKALTTKVSKRYNTQKRLIYNYILNKTKNANKPTNYNTLTNTIHHLYLTGWETIVLAKLDLENCLPGMGNNVNHGYILSYKLAPWQVMMPCEL